MAAHIRCFFLHPTHLAEESLRRFAPLDVRGWHCSNPAGFHDACVVLGEMYWSKDYDSEDSPVDRELEEDPRWPARCSCGFAFRPQDRRQHRFNRLYRIARSDKRTTLEQAPPGSMWLTGEGGQSLVVRTPAGDWTIDRPPKIGSVSDISVEPPIFIHELRNYYGRVVVPGYCGLLRNGWLVSA